MSELHPAARRQIEGHLATRIIASEPLGGGSIHQARRLRTSGGSFFVKYHRAPQATALLKSEVAGLEHLTAARTNLGIPRILLHGAAGDQYFLLLEYFAERPASPLFWERLGRGLAQVHRQTAAQFGHHPDNFIGSLAQSNRSHARWCDFYWFERIEPQLHLARDKGHLGKAELDLFGGFRRALPGLFPEEAPALIHGDLWSGNFLVGPNDLPVLIDPAVAYAHREMDWAMSRLFGGFAPRFYAAYQEAWPPAPGLADRLEYYQLYYLLVHLNLFGWSYRQAVLRIVRAFA
ncbi:MAG: fructosamine kinase family protein [Bacteroidota bacterium]